MARLLSRPRDQFCSVEGSRREPRRHAMIPYASMGTKRRLLLWRSSWIRSVVLQRERRSRWSALQSACARGTRRRRLHLLPWCHCGMCVWGGAGSSSSSAGSWRSHPSLPINVCARCGSGEGRPVDARRRSQWQLRAPTCHPVGRVVRVYDIDAVTKEVLLCMTHGEMSRVRQRVLGRSLTCFATDGSTLVVAVRALTPAGCRTSLQQGEATTCWSRSEGRRGGTGRRSPDRRSPVCRGPKVRLPFKRPRAMEGRSIERGVKVARAARIRDWEARRGGRGVD